MKRSKKFGIALVCLGIALVIAAGSLLAYNYWDDSRAMAASEDILQKIDEIRAQSKDDQQYDPAKPVVYDDMGKPIPDYVLDPNMAMPTITVDGYRYIGTITIPTLSIELPIMEDWDYTRMEISSCRYSGSIYLGDLVVCAHNYNSHFGRLDKLQKNDQVIVTDAKGNVFKYNVEQIETLNSKAVEEMTSGNWDLTLFTCNFSGRARVAVRCSIVE